ncbi:hypothetical protein KI387_004996, partial [Taxus chinensis]
MLCLDFGKNKPEHEPISNENRHLLIVSEDNGVSEKSVLAEENGLDEELNVEIKIVIGGAKEVLTLQGNKENQVIGVESRANEEIGLREEIGGSENNYESQVNSNENVADGGITIREEGEVVEESGLKENKGVNLKSYSCSKFSPKGMMGGSALANGDDNVALDLNMRKIPILGLNNAIVICGKSECLVLGENESCLKNNGDEVLRSPTDVDCTPRINRNLSPDEDVGQFSRSYKSRIYAELDILRSKISVETGQRIRGEEALSLWQNFWKEIIVNFSLIGVSLQSIEIDGDGMVDFINNICGHLTVSRIVETVVGRASMRAELENEVKMLIDNKNTEISRLRDKIQYYELVNHEMSQWNQEDPFKKHTLHHKITPKQIHVGVTLLLLDGTFARRRVAAVEREVGGFRDLVDEGKVGSFRNRDRHWEECGSSNDVGSQIIWLATTGSSETHSHL